MIRRPLSPRQAVCYAALESMIEAGRCPTIRELGYRLGIRSTNGVNDHLRALERKGWITRDPLVARGICLTDPDTRDRRDARLLAACLRELEILAAAIDSGRQTDPAFWTLNVDPTLISRLRARLPAEVEA